ncbi:barnase [Xenorhabdus bovienii]|uniref:ribonuclease domain-containing protein n=1 Tax=Xenorhabdus bovienii TaxID=40576 RepID=UPI0023B2FD49|nr:ribonuclease domain-containing protein [Xenorhabdus bovienii]MDE9444439.1 barnase [Xenorhabdus bovienii]
MKKSILAGILLILAFVSITFAQGSESVGAEKSRQNTEVLESASSEPIGVLTKPKRVAQYLREHNNSRLPDYYLTKAQARNLGWDARKGNLCQVSPNTAIGGDRFSNRENKLPKKRDRQWFEADVNYSCGHRGSDRLLYSNDGLIYLTVDHYKTFKKLE